MNNIEGQSIGRYQVLEPLGEGGMAVVFRAFDTTLECSVAIKFIRLETAPAESTERTLKRFSREAKEMAALLHPNIVPVTDYGEFQGMPFLVMRYLPGGTLKDLIRSRAPLPCAEAARLLAPIARALEFAHRTTTYTNSKAMPQTVYLKLVRNGNNIQSFYSADGNGWVNSGSIDYPGVPSEITVGLAVINNWQNNSFYADYDYFKITRNP